MRRFLYLAVLGVAAAGLVLAAPSVSQAQGDCGYGGYGGSAAYGRSYAPGYSGYEPTHGRGYGSAYGRSFAPSYGGRPAIEHPTSRHWTPDAGWHTHGHIHVPHRGHYHTYRY